MFNTRPSFESKLDSTFEESASIDQRATSYGSQASIDLLSWNRAQGGRAGSVAIVTQKMMNTKYVRKDPISIEEVYNVRKTLTFCMKTAIKKSVRDQAMNVRRDLTVKDFKHVNKIKFAANDPANLIQKPFKYKDYAPAVFKTLRQSFGIDEKEYLDALTETDLDNFQSSSKSGCFFFFSGDGQYLIKGTTQSEARFFRSIFQDYTGHMRRSQNSLIVRFCGLFRLKVPHIRKRVHFIVMRSVYSESEFHPCHVVYDLKGSTIGRLAAEGSHVKKDQDFIEERMKSGRKLDLGSERERKTLIGALKNDVVWLQKNNIMDYSLLIGIHDMDRPLNHAEVMNLKSGRFESVDSQVDAKTLQREEEIAKKRRKTTLSRFSVVKSDSTRETYYIAIIDILQPYNRKKRAENFLKKMYFDAHSISVMPAKEYGDRFFDFMTEATTAKSTKGDASAFLSENKKSSKKRGKKKKDIMGAL